MTSKKALALHNLLISLINFAAEMGLDALGRIEFASQALKRLDEEFKLLEKGGNK